MDIIANRVYILEMLDSLKSWTSPPALTDGLFPKRLPAKIFHGGVTHVETRDLRQLQDAKKLAVTNLYRNIYKDKDKVKQAPRTSN